MNRLLPATHYRVGTVLLALLGAAILWTVCGSIDIVVQAQGKLVPSDFVKVSQPTEAGTVTELLVKDGQSVRKGSVLARVDATQEATELESEKEELARLQLTLKAQDAALRGQPLPIPTTAAQKAVVEEYALRRRAYDDALTQAKAAVLKASHDLAAGKEELTKQKLSLAIVERSEAAHRSLLDVGLVSSITLADKERERVEREQSERTQRENVSSLQAAAMQAGSAQAHTTSDYLRQLSSDRAQTVAQAQKLTHTVARLQHRVSLAELRAPVDGIVNSLAIRGPGQVVSAGTVLMTVVPADVPLIAEVWVRNEDAGFVFPGMAVQVKVSTFPFQKYGWLEGTLEWVGADSEVPESMKNAQGEPLFFKARVQLPKQALTRDGKDYPLKPGMQLVADIQLGKRSLFEYLTSPLKKAVLEAARER